MRRPDYDERFRPGFDNFDEGSEEGFQQVNWGRGGFGPGPRQGWGRGPQFWGGYRRGPQFWGGFGFGPQFWGRGPQFWGGFGPPQHPKGRGGWGGHEHGHGQHGHGWGHWGYSRKERLDMMIEGLEQFQAHLERRLGRVKSRLEELRAERARSQESAPAQPKAEAGSATTGEDVAEL